MFGDHGRPNFLRSDNGGDFIAASLTSWLASGGRRVFIEKGRPQQNAVVERFNGTMHDEKLGGEEFTSLLEGLVVPAEWIEEYNARRPHGDSG